MFHKGRHHTVTNVPTISELAEMLTERTWCGCNGFTCLVDQTYVFLNDATSPDGAQEYAVYKVEWKGFGVGYSRQIESVTFGWLDKEKAEQLITEILKGEFDKENYGENDVHIDSIQEHRCPHCA